MVFVRVTGFSAEPAGSGDVHRAQDYLAVGRSGVVHVGSLLGVGGAEGIGDRVVVSVT